MSTAPVPGNPPTAKSRAAKPAAAAKSAQIAASERQPAPDFTLPREDGSLVRLQDLRGQRLVLYFYPRDATPACTLEGQDFSALQSAFAALNTQVLGVSRDSVASHQRFCSRAGITVPLLSDAEGSTCEAYGVWVEKTLYGKTSMGIERSTFLIDAEGRIAQVWRKVRQKGHAQAVLDAVRAL